MNHEIYLIYKMHKNEDKNQLYPLMRATMSTIINSMENSDKETWLDWRNENQISHLIHVY